MSEHALQALHFNVSRNKSPTVSACTLSTTPEPDSSHRSSTPKSGTSPTSLLSTEPWYALEERIERAIRFPQTLTEREREDLESRIASSDYARDLATFFETFYAELASVAISPTTPKISEGLSQIDEATSKRALQGCVDHTLER